jgi:Holliday junction DNA helicase RuvA
MIACLRGTILHRGVNRVVVDVQGVGYDVAVSLTTLESLPQNGEVFLHIHTALRENALELYGFHAEQEKHLFEMLITVNGIGPRTGLLILSGISPEGFRRAVLDGDVTRLTTVPGIGKKSAERIVLELREKIRKEGIAAITSSDRSSRAAFEQDLISSLVNLGYKDKIAASAAKKVLANTGPELLLADALRLALKDLMK